MAQRRVKIVCVNRSDLIFNFATLLLFFDQGQERMDDFGEVRRPSEELDRELEVLRSLNARTPKFVPVDSSPLVSEDPMGKKPASSSFLDRSGRPMDQNQYFADARVVSGEVLWSRSHRFSQDPVLSLGGLHFPVQDGNHGERAFLSWFGYVVLSSVTGHF